jgi:anti-anti-sigma factor
MNRDGRPTVAPHETDHSLPAPALSVRREGDCTIVALSGEIDIAYAPALREQLLGLLRPGASRLVVDLSGVTLCDASGLAVLVGVARRAGLLRGFLRLAAPAPLMSTVLRLTGLDSRFEIFAAVPDAIGAPAHPGVRDPGGFRARASLPA